MAFERSKLPDTSDSGGFNNSASYHESNANQNELPKPSANWMAALWARKYVSFVHNRKTTVQQTRETPSAENATSKAGRSETANLLSKHLSLAGAQAWSMTEMLLDAEFYAHGIDPSLIRPLEIAEDSKQIFEHAFRAYADTIKPERLSVLIGSEIGNIRRKYTSTDPRILGCVSMQFHYTGQMLLSRLSNLERDLFGPYLKVMDDHMYMPLRALYEAAANHSLNSVVLAAVQHLFPMSSQIAREVCEKVRRVNPNYKSYSGSLQSNAVRNSSIRDVEMFQVYLCLCVLDGNINHVQRELFPLCVMLYPPLNVDWMLVQEMLQVLTWEMADRLNAADIAIFMPYLRLFGDMFSQEVFRSLFPSSSALEPS